MSESNLLDPMRGAFGWAWRRGWRHLDRFAVGVVVFGVTAAVGGYTLGNQPFLILAAAVVAALVAAFGFALVRAPYEQRNALRTSNSELQNQISNQSPELVGEIIWVIPLAPIPQALGPVALVQMSIVNKGFQSVVRKWEPQVTINGAVVAANFRVLSQDAYLQMGQTGQQIHLTHADGIYDKGTVPLARGAEISGWVYLEVPGAAPNVLVTPGTHMEIGFHDFEDRRYSASYTIPVVPPPMSLVPYYPGSQSPISSQWPPIPTSQASAVAPRTNPRRRPKRPKRRK